MVPVLLHGTKASRLLSRKSSPGSKIGTKDSLEPGQKAQSVVVVATDGEILQRGYHSNKTVATILTLGRAIVTDEGR